MARVLINVKLTERQLNAVLKALDVATETCDDAFAKLTIKEGQALDRAVATMTAATHTTIRTYERDAITGEIQPRDLALPSGAHVTPQLVLDLINADDKHADPIQYRSHFVSPDGTYVIYGTFDPERPIEVVVTCNLRGDNAAALQAINSY